MTRVWTGATFAIALGCAATLAAQQTSSQTSQNPGSSSSRTITVTGCLQQGSGSTAGATGTTGTAGATTSAAGANEWTLTNATMGSGSSATTGAAGGAGATAGTAGAGAAGSSSATGSTYILEGATSELTPHKGHKVEVTGTLSSSSAAGGATSGAAGGAAGSTSRSAMAGQHLQVTSVKMVSANCQ